MESHPIADDGTVEFRPRQRTSVAYYVQLHQVGEMLDADFHVCVRSGLHCAPLVHQDEGTIEQKGAVRFSPGYFSDEEDIDQAIAGVADLANLAAPA